MKKRFAILLAGCLALTLAACSSNGNSGQPSQTHKEIRTQETLPESDETEDPDNCSIIVGGESLSIYESKQDIMSKLDKADLSYREGEPDTPDESRYDSYIYIGRWMQIYFLNNECVRLRVIDVDGSRKFVRTDKGIAPGNTYSKMTELYGDDFETHLYDSGRYKVYRYAFDDCIYEFGTEGSIYNIDVYVPDQAPVYDYGEEIQEIDLEIHNNEHNIYMGKCEDAEVRMVITRTEDDLSAAYITRDGAENFFQGELKKDSAEFTLNNDAGDYLHMAIDTDDNGIISINGGGLISGNNVVLTLNQDTFFPIGEDIANYYSSLGYEAEEAERFAAMIKDSVGDKSAFAKLLSYPISIYDGNKNTVIENETAMMEAYDELFGQDFKEQAGNMFTKYMFANYQGICVEDGIMWFHKESSGDYKITAIHLP